MSAEIINLRPDRPNRRDFISIGAAVSAVMAGIAPTAIAGTAGADPLPALVDEYYRLVDEVNNGPGSEEHNDRVYEQGNAAAQRIVDMVAPTAAGILAQLGLLPDVCGIGNTWHDERDDRLLDSIIAGVERLAAGGAA